MTEKASSTEMLQFVEQKHRSILVCASLCQIETPRQNDTPDFYRHLRAATVDSRRILRVLRPDFVHGACRLIVGDYAVVGLNSRIITPAACGKP